MGRFVPDLDHLVHVAAGRGRIICAIYRGACSLCRICTLQMSDLYSTGLAQQSISESQDIEESTVNRVRICIIYQRRDLSKV